MPWACPAWRLAGAEGEGGLRPLRPSRQVPDGSFALMPGFEAPIISGDDVPADSACPIVRPIRFREIPWPPA
jgi:hypothetical protein